MAELQTNTTSRSQAATQSPQSAPQVNSSAASGSQVQPGAATQLQNIGKISLQTGNPTPTRLTNLPSTQAVTSARQAEPPVAAKREINPAVWALPSLLFVLAVVLFWLTSRSSREKYNE